MTTVDKEGLNQAYDEVRDDSNETAWMVMSYDDKNVVVSDKGSDYEEFQSKFTEDERLYGYVRVTSGDEMSKRAKFVFIAWCGASVNPIKRAKVGVDKALVKSVIKSFAIEIAADEIADLEYDKVVDLARKAGGANYGTGSR